jgi:hypothetical protein
MRRLLLAANVGAIALVAAYGVIEYGAPVAATTIWGDDYKALMFKCDHVMREHFLAKQAISLDPNEVTVKNLQAAEIGLMDCHAYDKLRKKMLVWGVSEHKLSEIGLEALEEKAYDLRRFVEIHEIRY